MTEEQIIRLYGKRCAEHCDDCCVCEVWAMHDLIEAQAREIERLRGLIEPQWFYAGEDHSSDQCRFSIDEVLEDELCGCGPPIAGKHVVHVSTALPGPDIWVAVHVFTDEEKDARDDDETWTFEGFSTETEARAALEGTSHD